MSDTANGLANVNRWKAVEEELVKYLHRLRKTIHQMVHYHFSFLSFFIFSGRAENIEIKKYNNGKWKRYFNSTIAGNIN